MSQGPIENPRNDNANDNQTESQHSGEQTPDWDNYSPVDSKIVYVIVAISVIVLIAGIVMAIQYFRGDASGFIAPLLGA
ncbi:MAG: hypothetical protein Q3976_05165 [Corynebacterium sp.]|nr:hypothetical protein [Corynebacterium sp.]